MKASLIKIREIEYNRTLYHLSGCMGEETLCGITYVDADEDFEVQEGKNGTLQDVTCPKCLATAKYIRSIDEGVPKKENSPFVSPEYVTVTEQPEVQNPELNVGGMPNPRVFAEIKKVEPISKQIGLWEKARK